MLGEFRTKGTGEDDEVHESARDAVRAAMEGSKARYPDEVDGDVRLCRLWACPHARPDLMSHEDLDDCPSCYVVKAGDPRSLDEVVAAWLGGN
jgi:hypothetical protein